MIRVGSRLLARSLAVAGVVVVGTTLLAAPAYAATGTPLVTVVTMMHGDSETVSDVQWELPPDAAPGDVVTLSLPDHVGAEAGADFIASSGVSIGVVRLGASGEALIELNAAAADAANRRGELVVRSVIDTTPVVTTAASTAASTLRPGEEAGPFYGAPDRSRGNDYGAWTDGTLTRIHWVLESPRGPWDALDVIDRPGPGHRVDCGVGVRVRATSDVDPVTGYLLDPVDVPSERVSVSCDETEVRVHVQSVGDEIVEVSLETVLDVASTEVSNDGQFTATRAVPGTKSLSTALEPRLPVAPSPSPSPSPSSTQTVPPVVDAPGPGRSLPDRLAVTGTDASLPTGLGAVLVLAGVVGMAAHRRLPRRRA